jgi:hypothetical protein
MEKINITKEVNIDDRTYLIEIVITEIKKVIPISIEEIRSLESLLVYPEDKVKNELEEMLKNKRVK